MVTTTTVDQTVGEAPPTTTDGFAQPTDTTPQPFGPALTLPIFDGYGVLCSGAEPQEGNWYVTFEGPFASPELGEFEPIAEAYADFFSDAGFEPRRHPEEAIGFALVAGARDDAVASITLGNTAHSNLVVGAWARDPVGLEAAARSAAEDPSCYGVVEGMIIPGAVFTAELLDQAGVEGPAPSERDLRLVPLVGPEWTLRSGDLLVAGPSGVVQLRGGEPMATIISTPAVRTYPDSLGGLVVQTVEEVGEGDPWPDRLINAPIYWITGPGADPVLVFDPLDTRDDSHTFLYGVADRDGSPTAVYHGEQNDIFVLTHELTTREERMGDYVGGGQVSVDCIVWTGQDYVLLVSACPSLTAVRGRTVSLGNTMDRSSPLGMSARSPPMASQT